MSNSEAADARVSHRSNVFLAAVLHVGGSAFPVRIRNLSESGALLDGKDLPNEADSARLQRGPHSVVARVAWHKPGSCGLRFSSPVPVQEWIAYATGHKGQQTVDEMVATVRAGAATHDVAGVAKTFTPIDRMAAVEQLRMVAEQLEDVADKFSAIPAVIDQGMAGLQGLDLARQKLVDLSDRICLSER